MIKRLKSLSFDFECFCKLLLIILFTKLTYNITYYNSMPEYFLQMLAFMALILIAPHVDRILKLLELLKNTKRPTCQQLNKSPGHED